MTDFSLAPHPDLPGVPGPLVLVILDGVGLYRGRADGYDGNAVDIAATPNLDRLLASAPVRLQLKAHGPAVGLPSDSDMGNSEVGHNAIGAGRVFAQGAKLVNTALESGRLFSDAAWQELVERVTSNGSTFHLIGLLSDGNVHSHIDQLEALLRRLAEEQVPAVRVHPLADGRDVEPRSFHRYLKRLEDVLSELREAGVDAAVASGGGRMKITMDRYNASWEMVRRGWETHVLGRGRTFSSALEAVRTLRDENPGVVDQDLPPFVIADASGTPVGPITDGDSVVFFNFRGDRAIEISRAFTETGFERFDRERVPDVAYAGMMEYDGDLHIPPKFLVEPPAISRTVSEYLAHSGIRQVACAETQKYGHVTYFWNGNNSEKFIPELEDWIEIPSDDIPFEQRPEMKAREVCGAVEDVIRTAHHGFIRVNFANGDMVGHTGVLDAAVTAMEVVDECLGRLEAAVDEVGGTLIVTADHGNSDMMYDVDSNDNVKLDDNGQPSVRTSHTLNPVPWLLTGAESARYEVNTSIDAPGLANIAASILLLLGFEAPDDYEPALVVRRR